MDSIRWAEEIALKIHEKEKEVVKRSGNKIPYSANDGVFDDWSDDGHICWWTNGFFAGMLWQLYNAFGEASYMECAKKIEEKLDKNLMDHMGMDHDSGFKWLLTSGANYSINKDEASKNRLLLAASNLAGRLNLNAGLIRAWNDDGSGERAGTAIIDCLMNLPLLYNASKLTNDPRFAQIAMCHADNAIEAFLRDDGSVHHIITFDPFTGKVIKALGGQGMGDGSSWTRGQAWALYGFALSYHHTGKSEYLDAALKVAEYVISHIPASGIIPVDYDQPETCDFEDDTAAAITASGLLLLAKELSGTDSEKGQYYTEKAIWLLKTLSDERCNYDISCDHLLENCSAAYHDDRHGFPIIYGDYFFTEAILRLCNKEVFLW